MISEIDGPNISVYPDTNQIGVFNAGPRAQRRFGALFDVDDAVADTAASAGRRSCRQYRVHARQRASRARELPPPRAFAGYRAGEVSAACATSEQSESIAKARVLATSPEVGFIVATTHLPLRNAPRVSADRQARPLGSDYVRPGALRRHGSDAVCACSTSAGGTETATQATGSCLSGSGSPISARASPANRERSAF
jgi:hypothetical protein